MGYLASRILQAFVSLLAMTVVIFFLVRLTGDPLAARLPIEATEGDRQQMSRDLGLDRPLPVQYWIFLTDLAQGDLGTSVTYRPQSVAGIIKDNWTATFKLALVANVLSLIAAISLGVIAALRKDGIWDAFVRVLALIGQSAPSFWVGLMLMSIFAVRLGWVPTSGASGVKSYILPATTMALFIMPGTMRLIRSAMIEVLDSDYVKLERGLGWPERLIIWRYALRNAAIPAVTFAGMMLLASMAGAVVTETVFAWPGLGRLAVQAVSNRDFPLVQGIVLTFTAAYLLGNLLIDLLYGFIDPRIRYQTAS